MKWIWKAHRKIQSHISPPSTSFISKRTLGAETVESPLSETLAALHVPCFPFQPQRRGIFWENLTSEWICRDVSSWPARGAPSWNATSRYGGFERTKGRASHRHFDWKRPYLWKKMHLKKKKVIENILNIYKQVINSIYFIAIYFANIIFVVLLLFLVQAHFTHITFLSSIYLIIIHT